MSCVRALIAAGGHVIDGNAVEFSTLHAAIRGQHAVVVQLLLEHGATAVMNSVVAEACDNGKHCCNGLTALMMRTTVDTVKALLAAGADVHTTNNAGDTCLHVAAKKKKLESTDAMLTDKSWC
jgi:ankyrin repeat protein